MWAWIYAGSLFVGGTADDKFTTFAGRGLRLCPLSTLSLVFLIGCNDVLNVFVHWKEAAVGAKRALTTLENFIFLINGWLFEFYLVLWPLSGFIIRCLKRLLSDRWVIRLILVLDVVIVVDIHGYLGVDGILSCSLCELLIRVNFDVWKFRLDLITILMRRNVFPVFAIARVWSKFYYLFSMTNTWRQRTGMNVALTLYA